jgi:hypothetical protein
MSPWFLIQKAHGTPRRLSFGAAGCPWRIQYENAFYHVFSRGNNQQDIFVTDDDRYLFLDTIGEMAKRFDCDIFAYVLMDNHYHLLLRTPKANLSRSMQWIHLWIPKVCRSNQKTLC